VILPGKKICFRNKSDLGPDLSAITFDMKMNEEGFNPEQIRVQHW